MARDTVMTDLPHRLRDALLAADYTVDDVADVLGPRAQAALGRGETTPAMTRTGGGSAVETLTRLFWLQRPVSRAAAEVALPDLVEHLAGAGLLSTSGDDVLARVEVRPQVMADPEQHPLWVLGDPAPGMDARPHRVDADQVLGISNASNSLSQQTLRGPIGRSLDLGTGCGVQALHLAAHSERVVATDVNARALWMTDFNAALNDVADRIEVRDGSLFTPLPGTPSIAS